MADEDSSVRVAVRVRPLSALCALPAARWSRPPPRSVRHSFRSAQASAQLLQRARPAVILDTPRYKSAAAPACCARSRLQQPP
jgi:hypothetical protein